MAVHKVIRTKSPAQPKPQHEPQHAKSARIGGPKPQKPQATDHQAKAELFKTLERLNHGYGAALAALDRLRKKDRRKIFPAACLNDFRNRTEMLQALANRDLLRLLAGHEEQEAKRIGSSSQGLKPGSFYSLSARLKPGPLIRT
jgi:hypothetical protein